MVKATGRATLRAGRGVCVAMSAALIAGCGLPTAGPYYEDLRYTEELATEADPGYDLIRVTPEIVAAAERTVVRLDGVAGFHFDGD